MLLPETSKSGDYVSLFAEIFDKGRKSVLSRFNKAF